MTIFARQGKLGYLVEEESEELTHPYPEPESPLLKNKVNHKCVVAYLKYEHTCVNEERGINALISLSLYHFAVSSGWYEGSCGSSDVFLYLV